MAFKLSQTATYSWPMKIVLPVDGGRRETHTFDAILRRLPQSRINEIVKLARAMDRGRGDTYEELSDQEAVREVLAGWDGVVDDSGEAVPFSESSLSALLEIPTVAAQIIKGWFESLDGAKRKN